MNAEHKTRDSEVAAGPVKVDRFSRRASISGEEVRLTALEHRLLVTLVERSGRAQTRQQLYQDVWMASPHVETRTVDMHIQRLRRKLGDSAGLIETVRGVGYRFKEHNGKSNRAS